MRSISALDVRARFGQVLDEAAAGERFVVERGGHPVAAIVPLSELDHMDPDRIRERRLAAVARLTQIGAQYREQHGSVDAAAWVREDRDHGHRV